MAKQTINIGTVGNDQTGDDLRTGGQKINDNFDELYLDVQALQVQVGVTGTGLGVTFDSGGIKFEGSTTDSHQTLLVVTDPTKDNTITLPDSSGTVALRSEIPALTNAYALSVAAVNTIVDSAYIALKTGTSFDSGTTYKLIRAYSIDSADAINLIDSAYVQQRGVVKSTADFYDKLTAIPGHVVPSLDSTYDLGDSNYKWKDLWLSGSTIHLGDATITNDGSNIKFGRPINANIEVQNSMDLQGNRIVDSASINMRSPKYNFRTIDGPTYVHFNQNAPQIRIGDSATPSGYIQLGHNITDNGSVGKGTIHYNKTSNEFKFRDSDGWFALQRTSYNDSDVTALVDSDYVQARADTVKLKVYTVATSPNTGVEGQMIYVSDGNSGSPCLAVYDAALSPPWARIAIGAAISI